MDSALCKFPDKPCFNRSEKKPSGFRLFSCPRNMIENPFQFGCAEIRIDQKPGLFPDFLAVSLCLEAVAVFCGSPALPYDCIVNGQSGFLVPYHGGFALVCDADGLYVFVRAVYFEDCFLGNSHLRRPDFHGIVFHPARLRVNLRKFLLCRAYDVAFFIIEYAS